MAGTIDFPDSPPIAYAIFAHCFAGSRHTPGAARTAKQLTEFGIATLRDPDPEATRTTEGAVVGTGSPRRRAQLAALGLGLRFRDIRGNLGTRLDMVGPGEDQLDAIVLAHAGLTRLDLRDRVTEVLDPIQMLPAPGQGALAVECREDDDRVLAALRPLDDADTRAAVTAERAILAELEAGCAAPVGALTEVVDDVDGPVLSLRAVVAATDGSSDLRRSATGPLEQAEDLGRSLARTLVADGAPAIADLSATHPTTASEHAQ